MSKKEKSSISSLLSYSYYFPFQQISYPYMSSYITASHYINIYIWCKSLDPLKTVLVFFVPKVVYEIKLLIS